MRKLFGKKVQPACSYCKYAKITADAKQILCLKRGPVSADSHCRKYRYNPLQRIPAPVPFLPHYNEEAFSLKDVSD